MKKKSVFVVALVLFLALSGLNFSVFGITESNAGDQTDCYDIALHVLENESYDCTRVQLERLNHLLYELPFTPLNSYGETIAVPLVNVIIPPEGSRDYFIIGVTYEPTPECISFILEYTGIPAELAYIAAGSASREILSCSKSQCNI